MESINEQVLFLSEEDAHVLISPQDLYQVIVTDWGRNRDLFDQHFLRISPDAPDCVLDDAFMAATEDLWYQIDTYCAAHTTPFSQHARVPAMELCDKIVEWTPAKAFARGVN